VPSFSGVGTPVDGEDCSDVLAIHALVAGIPIGHQVQSTHMLLSSATCFTLRFCVIRYVHLFPFTVLHDSQGYYTSSVNCSCSALSSIVTKFTMLTQHCTSLPFDNDSVRLAHMPNLTL
jgi:hypothetical protein